MSAHRFNRQIQFTLGIESEVQAIAAKRLVTEFLSELHRRFVVCRRNHLAFFMVVRDSLGFDGAVNLAAVLSADNDGQARMSVPWPSDERNDVDHKRQVEAMNMALSDLYFSQELLPAQRCCRAIELFLRDLADGLIADEGRIPPCQLLLYTIGDEAAFHLSGLLPEARQNVARDNLDLFDERLECFDRLVREWESNYAEEPGGCSNSRTNQNGPVHGR